MTAQRVLALGTHPGDIEIIFSGTLLRVQPLGCQIGEAFCVDAAVGRPAMSSLPAGLWRGREPSRAPALA